MAKDNQPITLGELNCITPPRINGDILSEHFDIRASLPVICLCCEHLSDQPDCNKQIPLIPVQNALVQAESKPDTPITKICSQFQLREIE